MVQLQWKIQFEELVAMDLSDEATASGEAELWRQRRTFQTPSQNAPIDVESNNIKN
jgi:hypothetical protein